MTLFRTSLLSLALGGALALTAAAGAVEAPKGPNASQQKELDTAREDMLRATKRFAELSGRYGSHGGHGPHLEHMSSSRPMIGVLLAPDPQGGVRITGVTPDGAAAGAGIKSGDRLLRINGKPISGNSAEERVDNTRTLLRNLDEQAAVKLTYVRDGREQEVGVTAKRDNRIAVFMSDGSMMRPGGDVTIRQVSGGEVEIEAQTIDVEGPGAEWTTEADGKLQHIVISTNDGHQGKPTVEKRIIRIECKDGKEACEQQAHSGATWHAESDGADEKVHHFVMRGGCEDGDDCEAPHLLAEAFRWSGLNLASVDARLGRYFGTDQGVLVLSTGPMLEQLQPGDVIQRVDGKPVSTPRAVMDVLREKPADSTVAVEYLRDRKTGTLQLKVPKPASFPLLIDKVGALGPHAEHHTETTIMMIGKDGKAEIVEHKGRY